MSGPREADGLPGGLSDGRSGGLSGRVALVTGSGRAGGLGLAMAARLAADGAAVALHDLGRTGDRTAPAHGVGTGDDLERARAGLEAKGATVSAHTADLRREDEIERMIGEVVAAHGRLDMLINNAGVGYLFGPLAEMEAGDLDTVLGVNLRAPFLAIKHAVPHLARGGRGRVVNIASQAAKSGFAFASAYTASKHGLLGLTRSAALELAERGITVNAICPNHVTTGLGAWQNAFMSEARGQSEADYLAEMRARIPLGRPGLPEDTAAVCAFLCSDAAHYVTAEAINVSGGEEYH